MSGSSSFDTLFSNPRRLIKIKYLVQNNVTILMKKEQKQENIYEKIIYCIHDYYQIQIRRPKTTTNNLFLQFIFEERIHEHFDLRYKATFYLIKVFKIK